MPNRNPYLASADDGFLNCREFRHQWDPQGRYYENKEVFIVLKCKRCDNYALLTWDARGKRIERRMVYVTEGYLNKTGERFSPDERRAEIIKRSKWQGGTKEFNSLLDKLIGEVY
jgi:hypothetical protein